MMPSLSYFEPLLAFIRGNLTAVTKDHICSSVACKWCGANYSTRTQVNDKLELSKQAFEPNNFKLVKQKYIYKVQVYQPWDK